MRVISGRFKGFALPSAASATRPTTDRTKEAIFSHLDSWGVLIDARVLDLFAGTGALGIEALSRGSRTLTSVDDSAAAVSSLRRVFGALPGHPQWQAQMTTQVVRQRVEQFVGAYHGPAFEVVFLDPPYDYPTENCNRLLETIVERGLVNEHSTVILERSMRSKDIAAPTGWSVTDSKTYGETVVWYLETPALV